MRIIASFHNEVQTIEHKAFVRSNAMMLMPIKLTVAVCYNEVGELMSCKFGSFVAESCDFCPG